MPVSMVGRADHLAELVRAWSQLGSTPLPVVITGAAGMGKSLLVAAALDAFTPRPDLVLSGAARLHTPAPYDWLAAVLSRRTLDLPLPPDALAWLAQLPDAPRERFAPDALLRLAVRAVRTMVGAGPAVLVVEDLHALDPASLNLIGELAVASEPPALLIVTSRPPETPVVARTLARLSGVPGAIRQHLGPLSPTDVASVLSEVYPSTSPAVAQAVHERTGGNPYWLTELLVAAGDEKSLVDEPLPEHLRLAGAGPAPDLTAREVEVLTCLAAGMSNKQVARSLGISIRTVTVHVSNLLRKTRSASRTEAALWAVHNLTSR
ncbi:LuxR C-terminal-related transcriptional regulator [Micromonospora sp. CPCC 206061]|uniref:LuxR C-terminal-related transcriptional regulator n=1 Tax=Micromonospora sp. CPCC 206061 TaxID=3122410 RepID=UPI002FEF2DB7